MPTINTNVAAIKARSNLEKVQREMDTSIARLSSGKRITRAHDDAAGQAIATRMESQIRGLTMNIRHAKDGQALVDTQDILECYPGRAPTHHSSSASSASSARRRISRPRDRSCIVRRLGLDHCPARRAAPGSRSPPSSPLNLCG